MKNRSIFSFSLMASLAFVLAFSSCDKTESPEADFTYTPDGLKVVFQNFSKHADTYTWDFGDGNTSTEENPTHSYAQEGTFTVTLTAKGDGTDAYSEDIAVSKPAIKVDSDFSDWAGYDTYYSDPSGANGTLLETKVTAKNGFLFFYVRATADAGPVIQLFVDKDNDGATGWDYWGQYETPGADYLLEFPMEDFTGQYGPTMAGSSLFGATDDDWPWTITIAAADAVTESSNWVTVGSEKVLEFSVAESLMPDLGSTIRVVFINADIDWEVAGSMPLINNDPPLPPATIEL